MAKQLKGLSKNPNEEKPKYRLIVMNNETFEERYSSIISAKTLYTILSSILLLLTLLIGAFIVFTPIKKLIPGYGDTANSPIVIELYRDLEEIEKSLDTQTTYLNSFKKILMAGDHSEIIEEARQQTKNKPPIIINKQNKTQQISNSSSNSTLYDMSLTPPVMGIVSAEFDPNIHHHGVDILAPKGTPISSILDGYIVHAGWNMETGNTIGVQHGDNVISFYKHNSVLLKKEGNFVKGGEVIAIIGNTGTLSSGPHLHFELWQNGIPLNPKDYFTFE